jgi:predicted DNA-binding transcriptional regulator AlpA
VAAIRSLLNLPDPATQPTLTTEEAAALFGVSKWLLYELAKKDEAPVVPLHLGRCLRWPTARVLAAVGLGES